MRLYKPWTVNFDRALTTKFEIPLRFETDYKVYEISNIDEARKKGRGIC